MSNPKIDAFNFGFHRKLAQLDLSDDQRDAVIQAGELFKQLYSQKGLKTAAEKQAILGALAGLAARGLGAIGRGAVSAGRGLLTKGMAGSSVRAAAGKAPSLMQRLQMGLGRGARAAGRGMNQLGQGAGRLQQMGTGGMLRALPGAAMRTATDPRFLAGGLAANAFSGGGAQPAPAAPQQTPDQPQFDPTMIQAGMA